MALGLPRPRTGRTSWPAGRQSGAHRWPSTVPALHHGVLGRGRPDTQPVRAAVSADSDQVESLRAMCGLRCQVMLEQDERGPVPAGQLGPDVPGGLRGLVRGACLGDHGQVAGFRTGRQPHPEASDARRGRAGPVAPQRLVGDQLPDRQQAARRGGRQDLRFLPAGQWAETSTASLLLPYACSIMARWPGIALARR
jgi:hypothetical protein